MSNKQKAIDNFLSIIAIALPGSPNLEILRNRFEKMSEKEFAKMIEQIENDELIIPVTVSNLGDEVVKLENILKAGDKLGVKWFERIWIHDPVTGVKYLTPHEYLLLDLPIRRQQQHLVKGKSVVENSKYTDPLSGQATGPSRSSRLSLPEVMILESAGHLKSIEEMMKVRGGDNVAYRESKRIISEQGAYNLSTLEQLKSRPTSVESLRAFLFAMHIDNNL